MPKVKESLSQPTYEYLLRQIMSGELKPGERIPETRVASAFGISRTPVRDALRHLESDGLVDLQPHRYAQVAQYSTETVRDIGTLRISLDGMAVKLALLYGSRSDFLRLRSIAEQCRQAMLAQNDALRRTYDCDFHKTLAEISGNHLLLQFQEELYLRVNFTLLYHKDAVVNERAHVQQHFDIVDALMEHDEPRALSLIYAHLRSFYDLDAAYPADFFQEKA